MRHFDHRDASIVHRRGNIDHLTRVMTTAIALETSRGDLALALGLGFLLVLLSIVVNATVFVVNESMAPRHSVV